MKYKIHLLLTIPVVYMFLLIQMNGNMMAY